MKAQRRHELQTNELADWLAQAISQVQPHLNKILIGVVAVVLVVWGIVFISNRTGASAEKAWDEYYQASGQEGLEQRISQLARVADEYRGTVAGLWARQSAGDARLLRGTNLSYRKRVDGQAELEKAKADFLAVINEAPALGKAKGEELRLRATWGLAQTYESLAERDNAIKHYEEVAKTWPDSAFGKAARQRAEYLQGMGDWFDWYAKVDPSSIKPTARGELFPPGFDHPTPRPQPQPFDDLPDLPDLSLPEPLDVTGPSSGVNFDDLTPPPSPQPDESAKPAGDSAPAEQSPPKGNDAPADQGDKDGASSPMSPSPDGDDGDAAPRGN